MSVFKQTATTPVTSETPPQGAHPAVLIGLIDLGTQDDTYQGKPRKARKVYLLWELTGEKVPGINRNHVIGREYSLSFTPKSGLRLMLEKWRGRPYADEEEVDISKVVGKPCLVTLSHKTGSNKDRVFASLESVGPLPRGMEAPRQTLPTVVWEIGGGNPFPEYNWLPYAFGEPLLDVVRRSPEWQKLHGAPAAGPGGNGTGRSTGQAAQAAEPEPAAVGADEIPF